MPDTWNGLIDTAILGPLTQVFGDTVTYVYADGGSQTIEAIFDEQFLSLSPLGNGPFPSTEAFSLGAPGAITTARPVLGVQLSQFVQRLPLQGDTLSVQPAVGPATWYKVKEVQADGHGAAKLTLQTVKFP